MTLDSDPAARWDRSRWATNSRRNGWRRRLPERNAPVKALLLEQSIAAGVGNIYADEALFLSGIRPDRPASELSADEVGQAVGRGL